MSLAEPVLTAVQAALAAEHAAVYAYGVCGGVLAAGSAEGVRARDGYLVHQRRRDRLQEDLRAEGVEPVAALPGYGIPQPVTDAGSAARLARLVEDACAAAYVELVRRATGPIRRMAVDSLTRAATRGLDWGANPVAFPGLQQP
ncbi:hypothetical protein BH20ACT6_BH20ACT6_05940 [soil metagenome]